MILSTKKGLGALLAAVFVVNFAETHLETAIAGWAGFGRDWGPRIAAAMGTLEGGFRFTQHDSTSLPIIYAYSISYFAVLPAMMAAVAIVLARRADLKAFRIFTLAVTFDYAISLPFFLLFPLPERWAFPESGAILLSDVWSTGLIKALRLISGLDNSFPSTHVSFAVLTALVMIRVGGRYRWTFLPIALTVVVSTFVLGLHWLPDILAGGALGVLAVLLAERFDHSLAEVSGEATPTPIAVVAS